MTRPGIGMVFGLAGAVLFGWLATTSLDGTPDALGAAGPAPALLGPMLWALVILCVAFFVVDALMLGYAMTTRGRLRRRWGSDGYAGLYEWWKHLAPRVVVAAGAEVRASLSDLPRHQRRQLATTEFGDLAGWTVPGPVMPLPVWISYQEVVLLVAPPRQGKTGWLGNAVIDFPGAAVVASTRPDLFHLTAGARARQGRQVIVLNPRELGQILSTMHWSPVLGAKDPEIANLHAAAMVEGARDSAQRHSSGNERFFEQRATMLLRVYLMAAAAAGLGMAEVAAWTRDGDDQAPLRLISRHRGQIPAGWQEELRQLLTSEAGKFRESVFFTVGVATSFMGDPRAARVATVGPRDGVFDVRRFLDCAATLYLIGNDEQGGGTIAPLLSALTAHIQHHCVKLAAENLRLNGGRLDPPLLMALDEATQITPVPLNDWVSYCGGLGIHLIIVVQGLSKLVERWGIDGAAFIRQCSSATLFFGGGMHTESQRDISELIGYRDQRVERQNGAGASTRRVPILDAADIRRIPRWHILCVIRTAAPTIVRYLPVWKRPDVEPSGAQELPEDDLAA